METYKKGISLIVLVITIIVLSILAATVIISISNTNIIEEANNTVDKYNQKQYETQLNTAYASWLLDNSGETFTYKNMDDLADYGFDKAALPKGTVLVLKNNSPQLATADVWDGVTVATSFAGGTGTVTDPYIINTAAELAYLSQIENAGTATRSAYYKLTNNIDLNNKAFTPINLSGYFEGNNCTIFNLNINVPDGDASLFGSFDGLVDNGNFYTVGGVYDLTISGGTITGKYAAGFYLDMDCVELQRCCNAGVKIVGTMSASGVMLSIQYGSASDCVNYADVTGGDAAGILLRGGIGTGTYSSYNYGNITATSGEAQGIGVASSSCYNYGNVHGVTSAAGISLDEDYYSWGNNDDNYNYGTVTVEEGGTIYTYGEATN